MHLTSGNMEKLDIYVSCYIVHPCPCLYVNSVNTKSVCEPLSQSCSRAGLLYRWGHMCLASCYLTTARIVRPLVELLASLIWATAVLLWLPEMFCEFPLLATDIPWAFHSYLLWAIAGMSYFIFIFLAPFTLARSATQTLPKKGGGWCCHSFCFVHVNVFSDMGKWMFIAGKSKRGLLKGNGMGGTSRKSQCSLENCCAP